VSTFAIWSKYSGRAETYSAFATPVAADIAIATRGNPETMGPAIDVKHPSPSRKLRANRLAAQRQQSLVAENRQVQKEAKEIASWQSPTASLLSSSSDDLFKSLPQLNENANEMKSFLPNRSNDKEK
jgi:SLT domain-containing protein